MRNQRERPTHIFVLASVAVALAFTACSPQPSEGSAKSLVEQLIQQNAHGCMKLISLEKTNGVENDFMGHRTYNLECSATVEFLQDCYCDLYSDFTATPGRLLGEYDVTPNHELRRKPQYEGRFLGWDYKGPPAMHFWRRGDRETLIKIKLGFEKTERGWRDKLGNLH